MVEGCFGGMDVRFEARGFARFAWGVLAFTVAVILWGAYVRATGSGAGCGEHWPLCNGVIVPREPAVATRIEFTHRVTSGLSLVLIGGLVWWARRAFPARHAARRAAWSAAAFIVSEALIGAGLVLFGLVADDRSGARAISLGVHLTNTFLLLAALGWTALAAYPGLGGRLALRQAGIAGAAALALGTCLVVGITGAITALGDTLFPTGSLAAGLAQDTDPGAHLLVRLRVYHPVLAFVSALGFLAYAQHLQRRVRPTVAPLVARGSAVLLGVVATQVVAGVVNVLLLAPIWLQMIHLLLADVLWVTLVLLTAVVAIEPEDK